MSKSPTLARPARSAGDPPRRPGHGGSQCDPFVRQHAHGVTAARGGEGAAREFCELIMRAQGTLEAAQGAYL